MSTRALIIAPILDDPATERPIGDWTIGSVHCDGYIAHLGTLLLTQYNETEAEAEYLASASYESIPDDSDEWPEPHGNGITVDTLADAMHFFTHESDAEYAYIRRFGAWWVAHASVDAVFRVADAVRMTHWTASNFSAPPPSLATIA